MFGFDEWGYITPPELHDLTLEDFERIFVIDAERERLFRRLLDLVADVKGLGATGFYLWIDGSFVTKKRVPGDMDVVCFVDNQFFEQNEKRLFAIRNRYEPDIDAFYVLHFPLEHPDYPQTARDRLGWFEFLRVDRQTNFKGLIEIQF